MRSLTRPVNLSSQEIYTISCAYLDLKNTLSVLKACNGTAFDLKIFDVSLDDCDDTIASLEATFPFLTHFEAE